VNEQVESSGRSFELETVRTETLPEGALFVSLDGVLYQVVMAGSAGFRKAEPWPWPPHAWVGATGEHRAVALVSGSLLARNYPVVAEGRLLPTVTRSQLLTPDGQAGHYVFRTEQLTKLAARLDEALAHQSGLAAWKERHRWVLSDRQRTFRVYHYQRNNLGEKVDLDARFAEEHIEALPCGQGPSYWQYIPGWEDTLDTREKSPHPSLESAIEAAIAEVTTIIPAPPGSPTVTAEEKKEEGKEKEKEKEAEEEKEAHLAMEALLEPEAIAAQLVAAAKRPTVTPKKAKPKMQPVAKAQPKPEVIAVEPAAPAKPPVVTPEKAEPEVQPIAKVQPKPEVTAAEPAALAKPPVVTPEKAEPKVQPVAKVQPKPGVIAAEPAAPAKPPVVTPEKVEPEVQPVAKAQPEPEAMAVEPAAPAKPPAVTPEKAEPKVRPVAEVPVEPEVVVAKPSAPAEPAAAAPPKAELEVQAAPTTPPATQAKTVPPEATAAEPKVETPLEPSESAPPPVRKRKPSARKEAQPREPKKRTARAKTPSRRKPSAPEEKAAKPKSSSQRRTKMPKQSPSKEKAPATIISVDIGYGYTKGIGPKGFRFSFPSVIGTAEDIRFATDLIHGEEELAVEFGDRRFFYGEQALLQSRVQSAIFDRSRVHDHTYKMLFAASLVEVAESVPNSEHLKVVTGLPVDFFSDRTEVVKSFEGVYRVSTDRSMKFTVESVFVAPQPFGSLFRELLSEKGKIADDDMENGRVAVIDVGTYTTDFVVSDRLRYVQRLSGSIRIGWNEVVNQVQQALADMHRLELMPHEVDQALRAGKVRVRGEPVSLEPLIEPALVDIQTAIIARARDLWGEGADMDMILVSGGGGPHLYDAIHSVYPHARLLDDAFWANAEGFYRFAQRPATFGE
jgi:plasmid segregation protein ParM